MYVKINLRNGYFYEGLLLNEDEHFITVRDRKEREISVNKADIVTKEVIEHD